MEGVKLPPPLSTQIKYGNINDDRIKNVEKSIEKIKKKNANKKIKLKKIQIRKSNKKNANKKLIN